MIRIKPLLRKIQSIKQGKMAIFTWKTGLKLAGAYIS